jgi:hypothetical protein
MKDYKSSSYYAGGTHAGNATKWIHKLWNDELNIGVIYHTSAKTSKVTKMWLQFGSGHNISVIPIDKNTDYEYAIEMLEKTYEVVLTHNYSVNK